MLSVDTPILMKDQGDSPKETPPNMNSFLGFLLTCWGVSCCKFRQIVWTAITMLGLLSGPLSYDPWVSTKVSPLAENRPKTKGFRHSHGFI